ncbi:MAG: hypothetical protein HYZ62_00780 [Candidatus Andersenbacteria bacterium]|nr:hypothetical protein [Candidatus Andersenbacteria bacterium]
MKKIYKEVALAAAVITGAWLLLQATQGFSGLWLYRYARSATELLLFGAFPSLCLAIIISHLVNSKLSWLEFLNISGACGLIGLPMILAIEYISFGNLPANIGLFNALGIGGSAAAILWRKGTSLSGSLPAPAYSHSTTLKTIVACGCLYLIVAISLFAMYYQLPDPDGYDWIVRYNNFFLHHENLAVTQRPFFYFFIYMLQTVAHIDQYAASKYVIPLFTGSLVLPAALLLKREMRWTSQALILLAPLSSASSILYLHTPIPQTISLILLLYAIYYLAYAYVTGKFFWYAAAGLVSFLAFFYHEASIFVCLPWLVATICYYRKQIYTFIKRNKTIAILISLLILSNVAVISPLPRFFFFWVGQFWQFMNVHGNWYFPARYTNVDGNTVGWTGLQGIIKYYGYYVGPLVFACTLLVLGRLTLKPKPAAVFKQAIANPTTMVALFGLCATLAVAEVFPRVFNISILPERAWLYAQIFYVFFIALYVQTQTAAQKKITPLLLLCILVNICGAMYVNYQKKYITPDYKQASLVWIKETLPENSIFVSTSDIYLLKFHAQKNLVYVPSPLLCFETKDDIKKLAGFLGNAGYTGDQPLDETLLFKNALSEYFNNHAKASLPEIISALQETAEEIKNRIQSPRDAAERYDMYVYYAKPHILDPYAGRPYIKKRTALGACKYPNLDDFPQSFTRVYNDKDQVKIWKIN